MINNKVLWGEGLFLRPQHFQVQDTYHSSQRALSMMLTHPYLYGIAETKIDKQLLESNLLSFQSIYAVFPDGTLYQAPNIDKLPKSVKLDTQDYGDNIYVFLNLEIIHSNANVQSEENANPTRYTRKSVEQQDLYSQAADSVVDVIQLSPSLQLSHTEQCLNNDVISLLVAKLVRTTQSIYVIDEDYIVPSVHIFSNQSLMNQTYRLITMINTKAVALYNHHRQSNSDLLEFRSSDIASFWLLHTLNSASAQLSHLYNSPKFHPERLYESLLNIVSQLTTFSPLYKVSELPNYQHNDMNECFDKIIGIMRELLNTVIASNFISIPLQQNRQSYYIGDLSSDKITYNSKFYLSISSSMPMHELVDLVPKRFKIATPDAVEKLVLSALPGIPLSHTHQVPSAIPVRPGFSYFMIESIGDLYNEMLSAETICIYIPNGFDDLKVELMAIV